jgi:hypothetical protein
MWSRVREELIMKHHFSVSVIGMVALIGGFAVTGEATVIGPSPYLSFADSPFSGADFQYFYLEDFEDGALNVPGVTASGGQIWDRGITNDSVDEDDGAIDGYGRALALWSGFGVAALTFSFDETTLGHLPTHVGIVWTDVGWTWPEFPLGYGNVQFEAYDAQGLSLGLSGPVLLGDGMFCGETAEDRFFGATHEGGISSFTISMPGQGSPGSLNWEVDHLQYGYQSQSVPDPGSTFALLSLAIGALLAGSKARHFSADRVR